MESSFPEWLTELFLRFSINYEGIWNYAIKTEPELLAKKMMWYGVVTGNGYHASAIFGAINLSIQTFAKPPSIAEFLELCKAETKRMAPFGVKQLENRRRAPPSALLAEYMGKHPLRDDDEFKLLFERYQGQERGTQVIKLIKRKLSGKRGTE